MWPAVCPGTSSTAKVQAERLHRVAAAEAYQRFGDVLCGRAVDGGAGGFAQGCHAADMIGMVVGD